MPVRSLGPALSPGVLLALWSVLVGSAVAAHDDSTRRIDPLLRYEMRARASASDQRDALIASPRVATSAMESAPRFACWVRVDPGTLLPPDLSVRLHGDQLASGHLRLEEVERLARIPGVLTIEAARHTRPYLDRSVAEIGADEVHRGSGSPPEYSGYTGSGTVVGIVDTGIDLAHGDFIVSNATRIHSLWDQTSVSADSPSGFGYGHEWSGAQINDGSAAAIDRVGHGTHVAGTAAGSGGSTKDGGSAYQFVGVAPEATLVIVKTDFLTSSIVDAVEYVFAQATSLGLPAVVNLSLGHQYGPHDGTEATDLAMNSLTGPGRIIVAASGNEQEDGIHAEALVRGGETEELRFDVSSYAPRPGAQNDVILLDGYYSDTEELQVTVITPRGHTVGPISRMLSGDVATADGSILIENDVFDPATEDRNVHIQIWDDPGGSPPQAGTWRILLENTTAPVTASGAEVDFWLYYHSFLQSQAPAFDPSWGMTASKLVASPATADSVIAVAAYVTRTSWRSVDGNSYSYNPAPSLGQIAPFSSNGPRRDGVVKPDIAAPGMGIGAALSRDHSTSNAWVLGDGVHFITQGTSMACPHVTGVVALMLEAHGPLSRMEIGKRLSATARVDEFTGTVPNVAFGAGKVDARSSLVQPPPILLLDLDMNRDEEGVHLSWSVPKSSESALFRVERTLAVPQASDATRLELGVTGPGPTYQFLDPDAPLGQETHYWLTALQLPEFVLGPFTAPAGSRPTRLSLSRPTPNPFSSEVRWKLTLPEPGVAVVDLIDPTGRRILRLEDDLLPAGTSTYSWDGRNGSGNRVGSGVYFLRARWNGVERTERVLLLR